MIRFTACRTDLCERTVDGRAATARKGPYIRYNGAERTATVGGDISVGVRQDEHMGRYPRQARNARMKCVECNAPVVETTGEQYVCINCGESPIAVRS